MHSRLEFVSPHKGEGQEEMHCFVKELPQELIGHVATQIFEEFSEKPVKQEVWQVQVEFSPYLFPGQTRAHIFIFGSAQEFGGQFDTQILEMFSPKPVLQLEEHKVVVFSPYLPTEQVDTQSLEGEVSPQLLEGHKATQIRLSLFL